MESLNIEYCGLVLTVNFEWCEASGDGFYEPHEPAHVEQIVSVMIEKHDIIELLSDSQYDEISEIIHEKMS